MENTTITNPTAHDTKLIELSHELGRAKSDLNWYISIKFRNREASVFGFDDKSAKAKARYDAACDALALHETDYTGWSRFWLVTNTNGHIHSSTNCSTCFDSTLFALLPELSGMSEADAVEAYGSVLCSVCFPSAPVEWTNGELKSKVANREARAAAKAEREAKRLEKALLPDGSELVVNEDNRYSERIKTLAAAKSWMTDYHCWLAWGNGHPSYPVDAYERIALAVSAKTGESVEAVKAAAAKRAEKKR